MIIEEAWIEYHPRRYIPGLVIVSESGADGEALGAVRDVEENASPEKPKFSIKVVIKGENT